MCAQQTRMLSNQQLPRFQPVFMASLNLVREQNRRKELFLPAVRSALPVSDGLHRRIANTSKHTCGASVSLQGPRCSGSKPQTRFSGGEKNFKDAESLDKLMLHGRGNGPAPRSGEGRPFQLRREPRHAHSHALGISRHASEQIEHPKHAECLVPS